MTTETETDNVFGNILKCNKSKRCLKIKESYKKGYEAGLNFKKKGYAQGLESCRIMSKEAERKRIAKLLENVRIGTTEIILEDLENVLKQLRKGEGK